MKGYANPFHSVAGQNFVACDLPVAQDTYVSTVSGFADDLRCVTKDLPVYLRFSAPPSPSSQQLKSSLPHRRCFWRQRHIRGLHRVFREVVDSLLELSPVCDSQENRSMMVRPPKCLLILQLIPSIYLITLSFLAFVNLRSGRTAWLPANNLKSCPLVHSILLATVFRYGQ